jgi:hypothetical protein
MMKKYRVVAVVLLVALSAAVWGWSRDSDASIRQAGGVIYYEWTGPEWLRTVWKKTGVSFGLAKKGTVVFRYDDLLDEEFVEIDLRGVECLILKCPQLTRRSAKHIASFRSITALFVPMNNVDDEWVAELSAMTNLERLNLRGSRISDKSLSTLTNVRSLRSLDVGLTQITRHGVPKSLDMPSLNDLGIDSTQASEKFAGDCKLRSPRIHLQINDDEWVGF